MESVTRHTIAVLVLHGRVSSTTFQTIDFATENTYITVRAISTDHRVSTKSIQGAGKAYRTYLVEHQCQRSFGVAMLTLCILHCASSVSRTRPCPNGFQDNFAETCSIALKNETWRECRNPEVVVISDFRFSAPVSRNLPRGAR